MGTAIRRPLDAAACAEADAQIYAAHEHDPRPNALYTTDGRRKPLDATDPAQEELREEWRQAYAQAGGGVEDPDAPPDIPPDEPVQPCPLRPAPRPPRDGPDPTITARWSKPEVLPDQNSAYPPGRAPFDTVPDNAKVEMLVDVTDVPDGTAATIYVLRCVGGGMVRRGQVGGLSVQGGQVKTAEGKRPTFTWDASHDPWRYWDKPFFYFHVRVDYRGLSATTPKDYRGQTAQTCRVAYWSVTYADSTSGLAGVLPEARNVKRRLDAVAHSQCGLNNSTGNTSYANLGSLIRNTYAFHEGSHGHVSHRLNHMPSSHAQDGAVDPPSFSYFGAKGRLPLGPWRSVVSIGNHRPALATVPAPTRFSFGAGGQIRIHQTGSEHFGRSRDFPSVPKVLTYLSCCLAGWESSLARSIVNRGCQNVIAFRRTIPDNDAATLGHTIFREFAKAKLNPAKVPDIFYREATPYHSSMRPILYGKGAGTATPWNANPVTRACEAADQAIAYQANKKWM